MVPPAPVRATLYETASVIAFQVKSAIPPGVAVKSIPVMGPGVVEAGTVAVAVVLKCRLL